VHHVTTAKAVDLIRAAKQRGLPVYGETCPPYLELTDAVYQEDDAHLFVVNPPIRKQADRERLWKGVQDGSIDVIGTDHCAYTLAQKARDKDNFDGTPAGFPGVETLLPFMYTRGVAEGRIDLPRLVELISTNPARIFGLYPRKGTLDIGSDADIVIYDPKVEIELAPSDLHMNVDFHPFTGMQIRGQVCSTFLRGVPVFADGRFRETGTGRFVSAKR
jgi:dihydropyrimidinase